MGDIKDQILSEIKKEKIKMHSKNYFLIASLLVLLTIIVSLSLVIFMARVVFYSIRVNAPHQFLRNNDISHFFGAFPILPVLIFILGLILLWFMFRRYEFSYKVHYLIFFLIVVISLGLLGFVFDRFDDGRQFLGPQVHKLALTNGYGNEWLVGMVIFEDERYFIQSPDGQIIELDNLDHKLDGLENKFLRIVGEIKEGKFFIKEIISNEQRPMHLMGGPRVKGVRR